MMNINPTPKRERNDYEAREAVQKAMASLLAKMMQPSDEAIEARRALDKAEEAYRDALLEAIKATRPRDW